jgi:hypothetical protein
MPLNCSTNTEQCFHESVLQASSVLQDLQRKVERLSDAMTLPMDPREQLQVLRTFATVNGFLAGVSDVLALEVDRWGL